jgi:hypothetical protein
VVSATRPSLAKEWSAWLPIAIPVFFFALAARRVATYGLVVEADEGVEAHLFQLLMPLDLIVMAYFAITWLPRRPLARVVLAVQCVAAAAIFVAIYTLEHAAG